MLASRFGLLSPTRHWLANTAEWAGPEPNLRQPYRGDIVLVGSDRGGERRRRCTRRRAPRFRGESFAHPTAVKNMDGRDEPRPSALFGCARKKGWRDSARLDLRPGRPAVAAAALGHELVELGLVLGVAQALQELLELTLLLFEPPQGLGAIFVERPVAARARIAAAGPAPRGALGVLPPLAGAAA